MKPILIILLAHLLITNACNKKDQQSSNATTNTATVVEKQTKEPATPKTEEPTEEEQEEEKETATKETTDTAVEDSVLTVTGQKISSQNWKLLSSSGGNTDGNYVVNLMADKSFQVYNHNRSDNQSLFFAGRWSVKNNETEVVLEPNKIHVETSNVPPPSDLNSLLAKSKKVNLQSSRQIYKIVEITEGNMTLTDPSGATLTFAAY